MVEIPYHEPHGSLLRTVLGQGHSSNTANARGSHHTILPMNITVKDRNYQQIVNRVPEFLEGKKRG